MQLTVIALSVPPEFNSSPGNFSVIEGQDISISINASGNPPIKKFTWTPLLVSSF